MINNQFAYVKLRKDRKPLVSLYIDGSQRCQLPVERVAGNVEFAKKVMITIAKKLTESVIDIADVFAERDKLLAADGFTIPARKRIAGPMFLQSLGRKHFSSFECRIEVLL
jgi:hypothetical protein